jgi:hypothetical protein
MMRRLVRRAVAITLMAVLVSFTARAQHTRRDEGTPTAAAALRPASEFERITNPRERAIALFTEAGKVLQSPRCLNCHPVERIPTQGDDGHPHSPAVNGGEDGHGVPGLSCASCHGHDNFNVLEPSPTIKSIPGNPKWALAPRSMAWQHQSLGAICAQLKDRTRNGGRTLTQIQDHIAHDDLVGWGWHPGAGRQPAPGTQAALGEIIQAWIASGAECPSS